jgi:hypothetical protein
MGTFESLSETSPNSGCNGDESVGLWTFDETSSGGVGGMGTLSQGDDRGGSKIEPDMVESGLGDACERSVNEDDGSTRWAFAGKSVVHVTACVTSCGVIPSLIPSVCSCNDEWDGMTAFEISGGGAGKGIVSDDLEDDSEGLDGTRSTVDTNSRGLTCFTFPSDSDVENDRD